MRSSRRHAALLAAIPLIAPTVAQAKARPAAPAGSFLHRQARSVTQLVQEVQADPTSRRRLARFFHQPEGRLADFFRHTLRTGSLTQPGDYTVYFVTGSGLVYPTQMALRPGTAFLSSSTGGPYC